MATSASTLESRAESQSATPMTAGALPIKLLTISDSMDRNAGFRFHFNRLDWLQIEDELGPDFGSAIGVDVVQGERLHAVAGHVTDEPDGAQARLLGGEDVGVDLGDCEGGFPVMGRVWTWCRGERLAGLRERRAETPDGW